MSRKTSLTAFVAVQCALLGALAAPSAQAAEIPAYFFGQWTVAANCTEASAGPATRVQTGLQFKISNDAKDGSYTLQAINTSGQQWATGWNSIKLEYRAGTKMATVPADFTCVAGAETRSASASPLLAMSGYVQSVEPQYQAQHWYALVKINGQLEHLLVFPRDVKGENSAIIVLESASAANAIKLDDDGVISSRN